ncbi:MAG: AprI/Inh family metalloprotease inhibitor [Pseudorhodoplanes sp.]
MRNLILALAVLTLPASAFAQAQAQQPQTEQPRQEQSKPEQKTISGTWEMSNSERDQLCNLTFKPESAKGGFKLDFDPACGDSIPPLKEVEAWILTNDALRLIDGRGRTVYEFTEVEIGMYEGERKGEGLYFLQTAESAAAFAPKRSADDMGGEWSMMKSEKPVCTLNLTKTATKGFDEFRLNYRQPCDPALTRLNPNVWRMDKGELVLASPNGQVWRFEEREPQRWWRVPEGADPIVLQKK